MHRLSQPLGWVLLVGATIISNGFTSAAPRGQPHIPKQTRHGQFQLLPEAQGMRYDSGMATRQRLVVRDAATWTNVWKQIVSSVRPAPPVPVVDFSRKLVIVAAMGTQSTGGYSINVEDVSMNGDNASISIMEQAPASGCSVTAALTAPVAVVVVPRFAGQVRFLERASQRSCK